MTLKDHFHPWLAGVIAKEQLIVPRDAFSGHKLSLGKKQLARHGGIDETKEGGRERERDRERERTERDGESGREGVLVGVGSAS